MNLSQATGIALILLAAASHASSAAGAEKRLNLAAKDFAEQAYARAAHGIRLGESFVAREAGALSAAFAAAKHALLQSAGAARRG